MLAPALKGTRPKATAAAPVRRAPEAAPRHVPGPAGGAVPRYLWRQLGSLGDSGAQVPALQTKLALGAVDDPLEHEAERVAEAVLAEAPTSAPSPAGSAVQRACAACEEEERGAVRRATDGDAARQGGDGAHASGVEAAAAAVADGGSPLPAGLRADFEPRLGHDLSAVRLHDDAAAGAAARGIGARAFTLGTDIAFAPGELAPQTKAGRRLLAHELAHVVQQARAPAAPAVRRQPFPGCDKRTTGIADADKRIELDRVGGLAMADLAHDRLKAAARRTIRLLDRHFHCPSTVDIRAIERAFGKLVEIIPSLEPRCLAAGSRTCRDGSLVSVSSSNVLEICPVSFAAQDAPSSLAASFIWAAAIRAGADKLCPWGSACYDDFAVPAADMLRHAAPFEELALELAGHDLDQPATIPCRPQSTGFSVRVPPGAVANPGLIRPLSGFDPPPPPGTNAVPVFEDTAGNRFIWSDSLPGAHPHLPGERGRFYLEADTRGIR
jgi:hypothetical protein